MTVEKSGWMENRYVFKNSRDAIAKGVAMVPEDRKKQGLTLINSVGFNITLSSLDK